MEVTKVLILLMLAVIVAACKKESVQLEQKSPDGKITITVKGEKANSVDPFAIDINTKGYGFDETISTEIFSSSIDSNNLKFNWKNNKECYFIFMQQDNSIRRMHLLVDDQKILFNEEGSTSVQSGNH